MISTSKDYLTQKQTAELLHISPRTLERMRVEGSPIPWTRCGRRVLYRRSDIDSYLESNLRHSTSER